MAKHTSDTRDILKKTIKGQTRHEESTVRLVETPTVACRYLKEYLVKRLVELH